MSSLEDFSNQLSSLPNWGKAAVAGGLALIIYIPYKWLMTKPRKSPIKEDWKSGVVYLYQFPRTKIVPSFSAPCLKVETWLRMAEIPYENIPCLLSPRSKEGTLPFIEYEGVEYPDSSFIIRFIMDIKLEDHLHDEQKALSRAFEEMAHDSLAKSHQIFRLENVSQFLHRKFALACFPIFFYCHRRPSQVSSMLSWSAMGKHSREEQINIGSDDLRSISKFLGTKHYFTGFKPTRIDATLFAFLAQIVYAPYENDHLNVIKNECPNLIEYVERIKNSSAR
ncbi:unnamed protein product [Cylicostephanus goldi]|uniref:GST N-terminal domain-containing protein n=1 Tax=Cylicostephanus goldi TaxID=71465 RepID=A0A3P6RLB8_CYLGO|nr:unnamed protein product [Cylicostephanus goldi]